MPVPTRRANTLVRQDVSREIPAIPIPPIQHAIEEQAFGQIVVCTCGGIVVLPGISPDVTGAFAAHIEPKKEVEKAQRAIHLRKA